MSYAMINEQRQAELRAAFERVQPKTHWKAAINAVIHVKDEADEMLLTEAVIHFTGSTPTFTKLANGKTRVRAVGYWVAIGA